MEKKYFVKYKEHTSRDAYTNKTRFFTAEDIEEEWLRFKGLCENPVSIADITVL